MRIEETDFATQRLILHISACKPVMHLQGNTAIFWVQAIHELMWDRPHPELLALSHCRLLDLPALSFRGRSGSTSRAHRQHMMTGSA
jgi:hypothetical protein